MALKHKIILVLIALLPVMPCQAQVNWPTPEVEQMYKAARDFHTAGNLKQAIILYKQAIQVAPNIMLLHRELGHALYLSGAYSEAKSTLEAVIDAGAADEQTYQVMGMSLLATGEKKKAKNIFQKGIERFQHSGILYYQAGKMHAEDNEDEKALETWLKGIENDPAYHLNYYEAARAYMGSRKPVWAVLYGEMFVNIEQQTPRAHDTRKMIMDAYRNVFKSVASGAVPKFGAGRNAAPSNFEEAVYHTYLKLSPVVSDGITTENLVMLRTRFMMDWQKQGYHNKYPFSLFTRHDDMIRNGYFDIYNQWLFGKAENEQQYEGWNKFHPDAMPEMEDYLKDKPYHPVAGDFYNDKEVNDVFLKKKKG